MLRIAADRGFCLWTCVEFCVYRVCLLIFKLHEVNEMRSFLNVGNPVSLEVAVSNVSVAKFLLFLLTLPWTLLCFLPNVWCTWKRVKFFQRVQANGQICSRSRWLLEESRTIAFREAGIRKVERDSLSRAANNRSKSERQRVDGSNCYTRKSEYSDIFTRVSYIFSIKIHWENGILGAKRLL